MTLRKNLITILKAVSLTLLAASPIKAADISKSPLPAYPNSAIVGYNDSKKNGKKDVTFDIHNKALSPSKYSHLNSKEEMQNEKKARKEPKAAKKKWQISLGISRSFPKLDAVNAEIRGIEAQLRQLAPDIKEFETWDDVYTGMLELRAERQKQGLSGGISFSYASGRISTSDNPMTVYSVPMSVDFQQRYRTTMVTPFVSYTFGKKVAGFTPKVYAGPNIAFLDSDSDLAYRVSVAPADVKVHTEYQDSTIGALAGIVLTRRNGNTSIMLEANYNWTRLNGNLTVTDSASGSVPYEKPADVDFSGPSVKVFAGQEF